MLFHVTARHDVDNCGMYSDERREALQAFIPIVSSRCEELGVKLHFAVAAHPDHVFFFLVEADDLISVCALLAEVPMKQEFDLKPVRAVSLNRP